LGGNLEKKRAQGKMHRLLIHPDEQGEIKGAFYATKEERFMVKEKGINVAEGSSSAQFSLRKINFE